MKKSKRITLSICIPTYNRADILIESLKNICDSQSSDYEVVICDNSSDNESRLLDSIIRDNNKVRYYKNSTNIGLVANVIQVLSKSKGIFSLLISDEDSVKTELLIEFLNNIVLSNSYLPNLILTSVVNPAGKFIIQYSDEILENSFKTFLKLTYSSSCLSGIIFQRDRIDFEKYYLNIKKPYNGLLGFFPHNIIVNDMMQNGITITTSKIFVKNWVSASDQIERIYDRPFYHFENILRTYKTRIDYIYLIDNFNVYQKFLISLKMLYQNLLTNLSYFNLYNDPAFSKYVINLDSINKKISIRNNIKANKIEMTEYFISYQKHIFWVIFARMASYYILWLVSLKLQAHKVKKGLLRYFNA